MKKISVGIAGGAGYTGGELIRILLHHPMAEIAFVHSKSNAGNPIYQVHQDLLGETSLCFSADFSGEIDVLFLCLGHGASRKFLEEQAVPQNVRIIDLSQDFRLPGTDRFDERRFVYGLPELNRDRIREAQHIANPGCFATAIQLGLLPLAKEGWLGEVHTTGITGSTGAGQGLSQSSHFSWRASNIQAYKTLQHQHLHEISASLKTLQAAPEPSIHFIPWRGDFTRGIFVSSQLRCEADLDTVVSIYRDYYRDHPFTQISEEPLFLKQVVNTNKCFLQLEKAGSQLVVHSAIDNLLKGASGQAVQNMNLLFGLPETEGLRLKANYF